MANLILLNLPMYNLTTIDQELKECNAIIWLLKNFLEKAQHHMKQQANQHCYEKSFEVGNMVHLLLHSTKTKKTHSNFMGLFKFLLILDSLLIIWHCLFPHCIFPTKFTLFFMYLT